MTNENHITASVSRPKTPIIGPTAAALLVSLVSTTVLAAGPEAGVEDAAVVSQPASTAVGHRPANSVAAAITPAANALSEPIRVAVANDAVEEIGRNAEPIATLQKKETPGLPYALILALVALIGLVPVSRSRR